MFEIINPGLEATVQDYPGRLGYWSVGIPPSGPMDPVAFRIANRLVENAEGAPGLEIAGLGPTIKFHDDARIAITGAKFKAKLDDAEIDWYTPVDVKAGSVLKMGSISGGGFRAYIAFAGGIDVPEYLGSYSTFPHGHFGGFEGRKLLKGDMVKVKKQTNPIKARTNLGITFKPDYPSHWEIGVIPGPHESPDFFTEAFTKTFYSTDYKVSYNANRLGIRLDGPIPEFSRKDGGEGGKHPSNMHDYTYAIGTINFSGNTPIIITADGPSLGGFISYATLPTAELWKAGQIKPGDSIRFIKMTHGEALQKQKDMETLISML